MCLAIYKPAELTISSLSLENGYRSNWSEHCGSGFAYNVNGTLHVVKGMFTFKEFYEKYKEVEKYPMLVHFRLATHGPRNVENCHPFVMCDGKFALIHNGIFPIRLKDPDLSDTGNFCKYIMEPTIKSGRYKDIELVEEAIGWNMICLMGADGEVIVYNAKSGHWNNGVWYSNSGYSWGGYRGCED